MNTAVLFQIQSFLILSLLLYGATQAKNRQKHTKLMLSGIIWDILLILQIEFSRGAINTATKAITNPMILNIHIAIALSTVILYFVMIYTGRKILKGQNNLLPLHKKLGLTTLGLRTLVFITSFWAA